MCPGRNDADNRLVAWNAAMSLEPAEFEALELGTPARRGSRSGPRPAGRGGAGAADPGDAEPGARARRRDPGPSRPPLPGPCRGAGRLVRHDDPPAPRPRARARAGCEACTEARPRNVSAARVFSLLPAPALSRRADRWPAVGRWLGPRCRLAIAAGPRPARPGAPPDRPGRPDGPRPPGEPPGGRRTSLVIAGVGAVASAVVITSAFALAGSSRPPAAVREVTPPWRRARRPGRRRRRPARAPRPGQGLVG